MQQHSFSTLGDRSDALRQPSPTSAHAISHSPRSIYQRTMEYILTRISSEDDDSLESYPDGGGDDSGDLEAATATTPCSRLQAAATATTPTPTPQPQPTTTCQICLDVVTPGECTELSACGHRFCVVCFAQFLTLKINDGQVKLTCFHEDPVAPATTDDTTTAGDPVVAVCGVAIAKDDIHRLVSQTVFAKFEKFQFNDCHAFPRQCPHCDFSMQCEGPESPQCQCPNCHQFFCFTHGTAHDSSVSCLQYDKKQLRHEKRNRRKIKRISKKCPSCMTPVEKNGGCNHMRCVTCSTDFCWLCGQALTEYIFDHYDWANMKGCAGQQMAHIHGLTTTNPYLLCVSRFVYYVIVYPIALVLTLVSMVLSLFFMPCMVRQSVTFWQVFKWAFRVFSICGYTAIEYACVTIVTGLAAGVFGLCWVCHELYKLGKKSMTLCCAWRRRKCAAGCFSTSCCAWRPSARAKQQPQHVDVTITSPQVIICNYHRG